MIPLTFKWVTSSSTDIKLIILNSVAYGVIAGVLCHLLLNGIPFILRKLSRDRLLPMDYEVKEKWATPPGGILPIWVYVYGFSFLLRCWSFTKRRRAIEFKNRHDGVEQHKMVSVEVKKTEN